MSLSLLIIGEKERQAIKSIMKHADGNRYTTEKIAQLKKGKIPPPGTLRDFILQLPHYKIVYSIEQQRKGWMKHISVSVSTRGKYPAVEAVNMIIEEFGFTGVVTDKDKIVYMDRQSSSINVLQDLVDHGIT